MRRTLNITLLIILFTVVGSHAGQLPPGAVPAHGLTITHPLPSYPSSLRAQHKGGSGIFLLHVDFDRGTMSRVTVEKSTGVPELDQSCIAALQQWTFKPH